VTQADFDSWVEGLWASPVMAAGFANASERQIWDLLLGRKIRGAERGGRLVVSMADVIRLVGAKPALTAALSGTIEAIEHK
jgi:hypothetical protein